MGYLAFDTLFSCQGARLLHRRSAQQTTPFPRANPRCSRGLGQVCARKAHTAKQLYQLVPIHARRVSRDLRPPPWRSERLHHPVRALRHRSRWSSALPCKRANPTCSTADGTVTQYWSRANVHPRVLLENCGVGVTDDSSDQVVPRLT